MNSAGVAISTILGLLALAGLGGGLWAVFRSAAQDARIKRLQDERDDYLSRLNYIEPRHRAVEQQNEVLLALHNPTDELTGLHDNQVEILRVINAQSALIRQIDRRLYEPRGSGPDGPS